MMSYFSKLDILEARRTPLQGVLLDQSFKLESEGNGNFRVTDHQGLIIKENYWYQHSTMKSGNTIDFFTKIKKLSLHQSIEIILNRKSNECNAVIWEFKDSTINVKKYLSETRNIDAMFSDQLIIQEQIKEDFSEAICFIQKDKNNKTNYIFRRSMSTKNNFKGEIKNSKKEFSFEININNGLISEKTTAIAERLYIVEGVIDACAMATLLKLKNTHYDQIKIITTAGYPHHSLKNRIQKIRANEIIIATDMDQTGRQFAKTIENMITTKNYTTPTYNAKDPADLLKAVKANQ